MNILELQDKIKNKEIEDETIISCDGFFNKIIYKNENLYWLDNDEFVKFSYLMESLKNNYDYKILKYIEDTPKKIEKLNGILEFRQDGNHISKLPNNEELMFKINEVIDYINNIDKK